MARAPARGTARNEVQWAWTAALILFLIIFIYVVGQGWHRLAAEGAVLSFRALLVAGVMTLTAIVFAYLAANDIAYFEWLRRRDEDERQLREPPRWIHFAILLVLMWSISAMGALTSFVYWSEGTDITLEALTDARRTMTALEERAGEVLESPEQAAKRARVESLLGALEDEMLAPRDDRYCGIGPASRAIIRDIQGELTDFRLLTGTVGRRNCDDPQLRETFATYREQAMTQLENDPSFAEEGGPERLQALAELRRDFAALSARMDGARDMLAGIDSGDGSALRDRYRQGRLVLEDAATQYAQTYQRVAVLAPGSLDGYPTEIDTSAVRGLDSIWDVLSLIMSRYDRGVTWLYLFGALAFDLVLILLFSQRHGARLKIYPPGPGNDRPRTPPLGQTRDPRFLWVNQEL